MMSKKTKIGRFAKECPRKLSELPNTPCVNALRRNEDISAGKRESIDTPGCPWSCSSANFNYCFWCLANDDSFDDYGIKEIASLLSLSPAQVDKALSLAIAKLKAPELRDDLIILSETVQELNNNQDDNTLYLMYNSSLAGLTPNIVSDVDIKTVNSLMGDKKK